MNTGNHRGLSRAERGAARFRSELLGRTALCGVLALGIAAALAPRAAQAGPEGTAVVGGAVDIARSGTHTEFTQHTQTAILNHDSFDIRTNESVNFAQPNANALAVNRVVGKDLPTSIAGKLTANGNVWVLNPSGVAIQGTAQVNVGGLIATSASIADEAIMSGGRSFAGAPEGSAVTNAGSITAGEGSVVLVAPVVSNTGTITANGSDVALGAGSGFAVDFEGDGLTRFQVTPADGVSLTSTGTISAQGGAAYLSAASAKAVQSAVVSIGGRVEATRIEERGGAIIITGGDNGVTQVTGEIDAAQAAGDGGRVVVTGELVDIAGTARIDASGVASGGTVEIGGAFQGGAIRSDVLAGAGAPESAPLPTARRTVVREGARIAADAGASGDGGTVIVWADEVTGFRGAISATGGMEGGDGGFAEVSGKGSLAFSGSADLTAPGGEAGTLLLDPDDVVISATDPSSEDGALDDSEILFGDPGATFTISTAALEASVDAANTVVQAGNSIAQEAGAAIDLSAGAANTLTLEAGGGGITLNDGLIGSGALLTLSTGGTIVANAGASLSNAGDVTLSGLGGIDFSAAPVTVGGVLSAGSSGTAIDLGNAGNDFGGRVDVTTYAFGGGDASVTLVADGAIGLGEVLAGSLSVTAGGSITDTDDKVIAISGATTMTARDGGNFFDIRLDNAIDGGFAHVLSESADNAFTGEDITVISLLGLRLGAVTANADGTADSTIAGGDGDVIVSSALGALELNGLVDVPGDLSAHGQEVLDTAGSVSVGGLASISANHDIVLDSATNDFGVVDAMSFSGNVTLVDADAITLRDVQAINELSVTATEIDTAEGLSTGIESANSSVTLVNAAGDATRLGGNEAGGGNSFVLSATDIGRITANEVVVDANGGDVTLADLNSSGRDFTIVSADANITDSFDIGANTLTFVNGSGGEMSFGSGPGGGWELSDNDLDRITAGAVAVDTKGQDFRLDGVTDLEEDLAVTAGSGIVRYEGASSGLGDVTVLSASAFAQVAGGDSLDLGGNLLSVTAGDIAIQSLTAESVTLNPADDVSFFGVNTVGDFTIDAGVRDIALFAAVSPGGGAQIQVDGGATLDFAALELVTDGGGITVNSGALADVDTLTLTALGAGGVGVLGLTGNDLVVDAGSGAVAFEDAATELDKLTVASSGSVGQNAGGTLAVGEGASFTSTGAIVLGAANDFSTVDAAGTNVTLNDADAIALGAVAASGDLTVSAGGTITDSAGEKLTVGGATSLSAGDGGVEFFDIVLDNAGADVAMLTGGVSAVGEDVTIVNGTGVVLGSVVTNADATADETIAGNEGDLTIRAGGAVSGGSLVTIAGDLDVTAQSFADPSNFFDIYFGPGSNLSLGGTLSLSGEDIFVQEASGNPVQIGTVIARADAVPDGTAIDLSGGVFGLRSHGATDGTVGSISVDGVLIVDGTGDFVFDNEDAHSVPRLHAFSGGALGLAGDVTLNTGTALVLDNFAGKFTIAGDLTLSAEGAINQAPGGITVGGLTATAANDAGTDFFDIRLEDGSNLISGTIALAGEDISLVNAAVGGTRLAAIAASADGAADGTIAGGAGGLSVVSRGGAITDAPGEAILVDGNTSLLASDGLGDFFDIALDNAGLHDFGSDFSAEGEDIALEALGGLRLGNFTAHADPTADATIDNANHGGLLVRAGGDVVQAGGSSILAEGDSSIVSGGAIALTEAGNDFADEGGTGALDLEAAGDIAVSDADSVALGTVQGASLSVSATDVAIGGTVEVTGTAGFTNSAGTGMVLGAPGTGAGFEITDLELSGIQATEIALVTTGIGGAGIEVQGAAMEESLTLDAGSGGVSFTGEATAIGGNLSVTAGGSVVQDLPSGGLSVAGTTGIVAEHPTDGFFDVRLVHGANDFGGKVSVTGGDIMLVDSGGIVLGSIDANANSDPLLSYQNGALLVQATTGSITDTVDEVVDVQGETVLIAAGAIELDNAGHNFDSDAGAAATDRVSVSGSSVTLADANSIRLGTLTTTGDLEVSAGSSITQSAALSVAGATRLSAGGDAALSQAGNDFGGAVDVSAGDVALADANTITLGDIDAAGGLTVAAGSIAQNASGVSVAGVTSLSATGNVALDEAANAFGGRVDASGADIALRDADTIQLGAVTAGGGLAVTAADGITDTAGHQIGVAGLASLDAGAGIDLDGSTHDFATVDLSASSAAVDEIDDIVLGNVTTDSLAVTTGGAITDTGTGIISATGDTTLTAASGGAFFDILLDGADGDPNDRPHAFGGLLTATGGDISIVDAGAMLLGNISANPGSGAGDLTLLAGGGITQQDGTSVTAPGTGDIHSASGDIVLTAAENDFADELGGSTVSLTAPGNISVVDADSIALGTSSGSSLDLSAADISAAGSLVFAGGITLANAEGDRIVLGRAVNDGDAGSFDLTDADVDNIQTTELLIATAAEGIEVQGATLGTGNLTLDAGAGSVDFTMAATTVGGTLTVTAGGAIGQDAAGSVAVDGRTSLTAGGAIALGNAANNFDADAGAGADALDEIDATGTEIALGDADAIALGAITATSLTVNAGGSITDSPGDSITVTGATSLTALAGGDAFDIRLDGIDGDPTDRPHDFSDMAGFSARGEDITVHDANAIRLGTMETGDAAAGTADATIASGNDGDLAVYAGGDITQSGELLVRGEAAFTSPGGILLGADNDFRGGVDAAAETVLLADRSAIALGEIRAKTLIVTADGTISDTAGRSIEVSGDATFTATDGAASFHDIRLDSGSHDFAGLGAVGEDLSVTDINAFDLAAIDLNAGDGSADGAIAGNGGRLSVDAGGAITQSGIVQAPGETSLRAAGDILLGLQNRFGSSVDAEGGFVTLTNADALRLGQIRAVEDLAVSAGGTITDTPGRSIEVGGRTSLAAASGGDFHDILLDNEDLAAGEVHDLGDRVDATGEDIRLTNIGALALGNVAPHSDATPDMTIDSGNNGDLTVRAGGTLTQHVALAIPGELDVTALDFVSGGYFDVLLTLENSIGGVISARAGDVSVRNAGGQTVLGAITSDGDLTVVSTAGSIDDSAGQAITVVGQTSLLAEGGAARFDVSLDNVDTHDFMGPVSATGEDIVLDDRNGIVLGAIDTGGGDLTVRAGGSITDTDGEAVTVGGATTLVARSVGSFFDIALDNADAHDFAGPVSATGDDIVFDDRNAIRLGAVDARGDLSISADGEVTDTDGEAVTVGGATTIRAADEVALDNEHTHDFAGSVSVTGGDVALNDRNKLQLGEVSASGDLSVTAAGSVTDTDGMGIVAGGQTTVRAADASGTDFHDIEFDNPDHHDFNAVRLTGEDIVLVDRADLTIASLEANSDGSPDPTVPGTGSIDLTVNSGDFRFDAAASGGGNAVPLQASGDISLTAHDGSFAVGGERRTLQDGLTFRSDSGNILLRLANGFVVEDIVGRGPFVLDAAAGRSHLVMGNGEGMEFYGIGTAEFLAQARSPDFNPLFVQALPGDPELFHVTGDLVLQAAHPVTLRIQNTSMSPNEGGGTTVAGRTFLAGAFDGLTMFGSFNGATGTSASIHGFEDLDGSFELGSENTANGCVILALSSCQPIGSLSLSLAFPDGLLLGVKFLDPAEDLDDPFTNRGDEEEWE